MIGVPSWASEDVDIERPSAARVYDHHLGGSHHCGGLCCSLATAEGRPDQAGSHTAPYQRTGTPMTMPSRVEVDALRAGFELVEPGLVYLPRWRPEPGSPPEERPERFMGLVAAGRLG